MKANIHPKWFEEAVVVCSCGNTFTMGATMPKIEVDVCYSCHPFYTGQMKYVDTAGRVDAFRAKQSSAQSGLVSKKEKRELKKQRKLEKELAKPETLAELREQVTKGKKKKASKKNV